MNNLKSYVNENIVTGSIRQQLRHPSGADKIWIIVEGIDDYKLFSKLIDGPYVRFEFNPNGWGKIRLLRAVSELLKETDRILGISDADFLHLEGRKETARNIFVTDFHDPEMMIIASDNAYFSVAAEYLSGKKDIWSLRENLLKSTDFIGGLRWINESENLELNFRNLGLGDFYDGKAFVLDEDKFLYAVMRRSPERKREVSKDNVIAKIKGISDFLNLCNGHDFQKAFALCINAVSKKGVKHEEIAKAFRIAYRFEDFQESDLYRQLKECSDRQSWSLFKQA